MILEARIYTPEQLIQPEQVARVVLGALLLGPEAEITDVRIRVALQRASQKTGYGNRRRLAIGGKLVRNRELTLKLECHRTIHFRTSREITSRVANVRSTAFFR